MSRELDAQVAEKPVTVQDIHDRLRCLGGWGSIYIPEYTHGSLRVDALILDTRTRWARGFEVKVSRSDFLADEKWKLYTQFCSSLSIACPSGLIQREEVGDPFGLLWIGRERFGTTATWVKKPKRFQKRDGMAWLWTYVHIIEHELPRLELENQRLSALQSISPTPSRSKT